MCLYSSVVLGMKIISSKFPWPIQLLAEHLLLPENSLGSKGQHWTKDINMVIYDTVDNSKQEIRKYHMSKKISRQCYREISMTSYKQVVLHGVWQCGKPNWKLDGTQVSSLIIRDRNISNYEINYVKYIWKRHACNIERRHFLKVGEREEEEMGDIYRDWVKIGKYETCYMKFGK